MPSRWRSSYRMSTTRAIATRELRARSIEQISHATQKQTDNTTEHNTVHKRTPLQSTAMEHATPGDSRSRTNERRPAHEHTNNGGNGNVCELRKGRGKEPRNERRKETQLARKASKPLARKASKPAACTTANHHKHRSKTSGKQNVLKMLPVTFSYPFQKCFIKNTIVTGQESVQTTGQESVQTSRLRYGKPP